MGEITSFGFGFGLKVVINYCFPIQVAVLSIQSKVIVMSNKKKVVFAGTTLC